MMIRLGAQANGAEILKTVGKVGVVGRVHSSAGGVGGVLPVGGAEELVELDGTATYSAESDNKGMVSQGKDLTAAISTPADSQSSITIPDDVKTQRLGEGRGLVLVWPRLLEVTHGGNVAH